MPHKASNSIAGTSRRNERIDKILMAASRLL
jgi:hypothetical protein